MTKTQHILELLKEQSRVTTALNGLACNEDTIKIRTGFLQTLFWVRKELMLYTDEEIYQAKNEDKIKQLQEKYRNSRAVTNDDKEEEKYKYENEPNMIEKIVLLNIAEKDAFLALAMYHMEVRGMALFAVYELVNNNKNKKEKRL
ncbi:hypothetical protein OIV57_17550 [Burkholderia pseudomallei]|uniref:hypothetical protein n=1 Tax=Burkholderia pseudomallei TaxID=28450 RepID=UPI0021F6D75C|nr:hypothetical protein [Burkholderia pseudomallei]MCV9913943.1 hypothetical protein [Burkholderia pseudomallei]MCW0071252.1 hypothetical protein [Burkholderia pseudomallei]